MRTRRAAGRAWTRGLLAAVAVLLLAGCSGGSGSSGGGTTTAGGASAPGSPATPGGSAEVTASGGATTGPARTPPGTGTGAGGATTPSTSASAARPARPGTWWRPARGVTWQWQLSGTLDLSVPAQVYDVDLFETSPQQVQQLHARGRKVICYLNAGAYEPNRPDSAKYPPSLLGSELDGWPGERWVDVRRLDLLQPLIAARLDLCRAKGFDGVEPDNVDAYVNDPGFPISAADQLRFNRWLAGMAHARGLAVGLKNDVEQAVALQPSFDFAVNEQCMQYDECATLSVFTRANKPVLHVEYDLAPGSFCPAARRLGFSSLHKNLDLDAVRASC